MAVNTCRRAPAGGGAGVHGMITGRQDRGRVRRAATWVAVVAALLAGCSSGGVDGDGGDAAGDAAGSGDPATTEVALPAGYEGHVSETYADDDHWLCRPGAAGDVCARDLDATAVAADGSTEVLPHRPAEDPPVDCFYVYPTTSRDPGPNSDLEPAEGEEVVTVLNQAARLTASCRVFAPLYRQVTLSMILGGPGGAGAGEGGPSPRDVAYGDVLDAFTHYLANDAGDRGFVLIGHSQGGSVLTRLIAEEIDDEPLLRDRLVAAYILGASVQVPEGDVVGATFDHMPLCEREDQTGCVVSYSSYRATRPPVPESLFGRSGDGTRAACVNPADLGGGPAPLEPYFLLDPPEGALLGGTAATPYTDPARGDEITTPWVTYPGLVEGECVDGDAYTYLALTVHGDPSGPRTDDIGGDLTDEWGMHLVDANVAMGDIVRLVAAQAAAYAG